VRFKNDGYLVHMFLFVQAKNLADAKKAEAVLLSGNATLIKGAAKKYGTGVTGQFAGPMSHAELQQEVINEPPGVYVIFCAMNAQDGREHFQLGMFRTITIVKSRVRWRPGDGASRPAAASPLGDSPDEG